MDTLKVDDLIKEVGEKEAVAIVAKLYQMPREEAALFIAIQLGETDGDVLVVGDDDQRRKEKEPAQ